MGGCVWVVCVFGDVVVFWSRVVFFCFTGVLFFWFGL